MQFVLLYFLKVTRTSDEDEDDVSVPDAVTNKTRKRPYQPTTISQLEVGAEEEEEIPRMKLRARIGKGNAHS